MLSAPSLLAVSHNFYAMSKSCEVCNIAIPEHYGNLLCEEHYRILVESQEKRRAEELDQVTKSPQSAVYPESVPPQTPIVSQTHFETHPDAQKPPSDAPKGDFGISDPSYQENPEMDDKDQILANLAQFIYSHDPVKKKEGKLLWYPQRNMYTFLRNRSRERVMAHPQYPKYIWKPDIVDVGCGAGVGSNVMSEEANFVWGIDKNQWSIEFAKEAFTRVKNGIYYSTQVTFDVIDIMKENREMMKFDYVVAIEVIEHIYDTHLFLKQIIKHFTKRDKKGDPHIPHGFTEFFISTPNRAFKKLRKDRPANIYHVREYLAFPEFHNLLSKYFEYVEILTQKGEKITEETHNQHEVVLAHCIYPR